MQNLKLWIGGKWVKPQSGHTFPTFNPTTGEEIAQIPLAGQKEIDMAVAAARKAYPEWSQLLATERSAYMMKIAASFRKNVAEISRLETLEQKTARERPARCSACTPLEQRQPIAVSFDEEYATAAGLPVDKLYLLLLAMIALTVVVLIRVVGMILVIALLTFPAAMARLFTHNMKIMMVLSVIFGFLFTVGGLWLSYELKLPSGATIILLGGLILAASFGVSKLRLKNKKHN